MIISKYFFKEANPIKDLDGANGEFDLLKNKSKVYSNFYGLTKVRLFLDQTATTHFYTGGKCRIEMDFCEQKPVSNLKLGLVIKDLRGNPILAINNHHYAKKLFLVPSIKGTICIDLDDFPVYGEGRYFCDLYLGNSEYDYDIIYDAFYFDLNSSDPLLSGCLLNPLFNHFYFGQIKFLEK
jgi:hypothetical protein